MVEVEITNYESITHTKLKIEGFTTLIGRNYLGKSSVLRAINAALTNKEGTDFISWGQTFCEVHIKFSDLDVLWHKEEGNNFYKINGKEYTKIGRGSPPQELLDAGFRPISVGDQKINLNYAVQFFPLFLVNKRDSKSADILTSVYGLDRIYKAIDLCNKEQRTNSDLLRVRDKDLTIVEKGMVKFNSFPDIASRLPDIKKIKTALIKKEEEIKKVHHWGTSLRDLAYHNRRLKPILDVSIPESQNIAKSIIEYATLVKYDREVTLLMSFLNKTEPIKDIYLPEKNVSDIKIIFSEYQSLVVWSSSYKKLSEEVKRLETIKTVKLPSASINVEDIPKLEAMQTDLTNKITDYKRCESEINDLASKIEEVKKELDSFDLCPLCGAKRV